jgi:hypothetical protein
MDTIAFQAALGETKAYLAKNVSEETLTFPSEDDVWTFITTRWPTISPHNAERLLGEAMRNIPEQSNTALSR